jgi:PPK2 family polyphosphate:nucleotide phosphotransferase
MSNDDFLVTPGTHVHLAEYSPGETGGLRNEDEARSRIAEARERLARAQDVLFANQSWTLLIVFQGMDAAGKDEAIAGMLSSMAPQGSSVATFKEPGGKELQHDYLWRFVRALPERGQVGIFNRSYYEEVLSSRVHTEKVVEQHLPEALRAAPNIWDQRFRQIKHFEQYMVENGILVVKFFMHVSKQKQGERLLERITSEDKRWQFSWSDIEDRQQWEQYMAAYEDVLSHTSTQWAPWHIVPSDHRWYSGLVVAEIVAQTIESLNLSYPEGSEEEQRARKQAQGMLEEEQREQGR